MYTYIEKYIHDGTIQPLKKEHIKLSQKML